jgi:hypothetical protein
MIIRRILQSVRNRSKKPETDDVATPPAVTNDVTPPPAQVRQPDALPATARQLERECILLKRTGTDLAAVWGGDGIVPPPPGPYRHWISVDARYLASGPGTAGVLSVYTNEDDCTSGITVYSQTAPLANHKGEYLYAHVSRSLPPPDASPELDNPSYTDQWMDNCPIYDDKDVVAVLGGWHFPWPDGDWEELRHRDLLVWTIAGSEPWVEVWRSEEGSTVMQRIT